MALKQEGVHFVLCPKQGNKIEGIVLNRACILGLFCAIQGQGFKPSGAHLYSNIGRVPPCPPPPPVPPGTPACSHSACTVSIRSFIRGKITPVLHKMCPK